MGYELRAMSFRRSGYVFQAGYSPLSVKGQVDRFKGFPTQNEWLHFAVDVTFCTPVPSPYVHQICG